MSSVKKCVFSLAQKLDSNCESHSVVNSRR